MSTTLLIYLILHVMLGTAAVILLIGYLLSISKKVPDIKSLKLTSFLAFLSIMASWIFGGIYYTSYYGSFVKPIILKGNMPWVHKIIMESKEHVFLFLPFATLAIFAISYFLRDRIESDDKFRKALIGLCFSVVSIGLAIAISGYLISGAVRK